MREWIRRLWGTFTRNPHDREMEDELRSHLELASEDMRRAGGSTGDSLRSARLRYGDVAQAIEAMRDQRGLPWLDDLARDVRHALRAFWRNPVFTAVAVLTLALAIGANTSMFSVVNAVLLRPLPYRSPEQLVMLWTGTPGQSALGRLGYRTVEEWKRRSTSFSDIAVHDPASVTWAATEGAERISVSRISPNYFSLLGVQPLHGRMFSEEEAEQRRRVALISYPFWQGRFGGSTNAIGTLLVLDGFPTQIIGILPDSLISDIDVWEPHTVFPDWQIRRTMRVPGSWFVLGRLRPNVTVDQAQTEMNEIARRLDDELSPADRNRGVSVVPLSLSVVGPNQRLALWMLIGAVSCVLLIAAANVASLTLARSVARAREIAIRTAIGASAGRIVRQLFTESMTLGVISGVLGTLLAVAGMHLIRVTGPVGLPRLDEVSLDLRVLAWALGISLLTGILIGLAPALRLSRQRGGKIRRGLVIAEFALAIILMAGAGLLIRSWQRAASVDLGFTPERILSMNLSTTSFASSAQRTHFYAAVLEQLESAPGIESAGIVSDLFISSDGERIVTAEANADVTSERVRLRVDEASPGFFTTIHAPLLRGRVFSAADGPDAPRVAIINDAMARRVWPGGDPIGRRFKFGPRDSNGSWFTVIGIVGDMRRQGLEIEPIPQVFAALTQDSSRLVQLLVRTSADDPVKMAGTVQAAVRRVDKSVPIYGIRTVEDRLGLFLTERRFQTSLLTGFSIVALLLAAIGIYGLIHYTVSTRTKEIGIRVAVGARPRDIFSIVVYEGLQLTAAGLVIGFAGALFVAQAGSSLLFGVTPTDPFTLTTVSLLLILVGAAACYFPARRAMKVDPVTALRQE